MSGKSLTSLTLYCLGLLCLLQSISVHGSASANVLMAATESSATVIASPPSAEKQKVLLILGLREEANLLVRISVFEELGEMEVESVYTDVAASADYQWPEADVYLATGTSGCRIALEALENRRILCTLLTEEGFLGLQADRFEQEQLSVLVIDQPVIRQARVAHRIYPSLARFSVFSSSGFFNDERENALAVDGFPFNVSVSLPSQLSDALSSHDALIATSDNSIFNASTLSTVLLTAYGYHKPVIGFSRGYVKAGALMSTYSTPSQILREVAQRLTSPSVPTEKAPTISYPRYFSVTVNTSVARSLGLIRNKHYDDGQTLIDEDFTP
ncbi:hypothetical protein ACUNV4_22565 [Granulosicoccus sp. 3-233]|uniref:hypothetical protein n=1 Tax=Granulosicoccus sp. 3-233 TaxID=3417969 RepID=UPI003D349D3D